MKESIRPRVSHVLRKYVASEWGGVESHISAVTDMQSQRGWQVDVFAPRCQEHERGPLAPAVHLHRYHSFLPFVGNANKRKEAIAHAGNIASLDLPLRVAAKRPSIVHLHTSRRIGGAAALGASLRKSPYVVSLHGPVASDQTWMKAETKERYQGLLDLGKPLGLLFGARDLLHRAARVICFNDDEYAGLAAFLPEAKIVRMSHGVDIDALSTGEGRVFLKEHPHLIGKLIVLCVGRLCRQKNQVLAVEAFARADLANAVLVFAGAETDAGYAQTIRRTASEEGCADKVVLLGNVAPQTMPALLAAASFVIVPSSQEAFGLTAIEAWAAGRPALCARTAGLTPLAAKLNDQRFFVVGSDPNEWAARLSTLVRSGDAMRAAGEEGQALVRGHLSWASRVDELLTLYRDVIEEHAA